MFVYEVVGLKAYSGEYEGVKYSGFYVHCLTESKDPKFEGRMAKEIKVKSKHNYIPRVGDIIHVTYDEYGISDIVPV